MTCSARVRRDERWDRSCPHPMYRQLRLGEKKGRAGRKRKRGGGGGGGKNYCLTPLSFLVQVNERRGTTRKGKERPTRRSIIFSFCFPPDPEEKGERRGDIWKKEKGGDEAPASDLKPPPYFVHAQERGGKEEKRGERPTLSYSFSPSIKKGKRERYEKGKENVARPF